MYSLAPPAAQGGSWTETLYSFTGGADGGGPEGNLAIDAAGALYGTTGGGGTASLGTVFRLSPPRSAGTPRVETVLYSFMGGSDGAVPTAGVVVGDGGVLYGTTFQGGSAGYGTVFSLTPPASRGAPWDEAVIHSFAGSPDDGVNAFAGLIIGNRRILYGTTISGGRARGGVVFSLKPPTSPGGDWTETVLHNFGAGPRTGRGWEPRGGLVLREGTDILYGTTEFTANAGRGHGDGILFALPSVSPGSEPTMRILHEFTGSDGAEPNAGVVQASSGIFYGTTENGGAQNRGTVFSYEP